MQSPVSITAFGSISPLGTSKEEVRTSYLANSHLMAKINGLKKDLRAELLPQQKEIINCIRQENTKYRGLDDSVLYAIYATRQTVKNAGWKASDNFGVNIGSSRGATQLFEKHYKSFLKEGRTEVLTSPTTTLGNIASWVAQDLKTQGPEISHSITCSTSLHAILNGVAWLQSGLTNKFLVGGSEAAITPFTIAQMKALKIYADNDENYPCLALDLTKDKNTMVLGEGAAALCLEKGKKEQALATISGIGYATETLRNNTSISAEAECFQRSMKMALNNMIPEDIDVIITHTPGTIAGDKAEVKAIKKVFGNKTPFLTTNKWKIGHTFGASGALSVEMALLMLEYQEFYPIPYLAATEGPSQIKTVMINAVGFGGNAVSLLLSK